MRSLTKKGSTKSVKKILDLYMDTNTIKKEKKKKFVKKS